MSLVWRRRTIARAVSGELSAPAEARLRRHLARCAPCRRHYDALSLVAMAVAPQAGTARARERLRAALGSTAPRSTPPAGRRWARRVPLLLLPVGALALYLVWPRAPEIVWRGDGSAARDDMRAVAARASLSLRLYARRRPGPGPVRLVGEVPGSGELHVTAREEVQLAYAGLTEARHLVLFGIDDQKRIHRYYPRAGNAAPLSPTREPRLLGPPLDAAELPRGRLRLVAVVTKMPVDSAAAEAQAQRAPNSDSAFEAILWVDP
jgi:hypothetical protein